MLPTEVEMMLERIGREKIKCKVLRAATIQEYEWCNLFCCCRSQPDVEHEGESLDYTWSLKFLTVTFIRLNADEKDIGFEVMYL